MQKGFGHDQTKYFLLPTQPTTRKGGLGSPSGKSTPGFSVPLRATAAPSRAASYWKQFWIAAVLVLFAATTYVGVSRYIITAVVIQGRSMAPTLHDGDHCFMDRWTLQRRSPVRGDLVVIRDPGHNDYAVKRIVGLPGEVVSIKEGYVYINNERLPEIYLDKGVHTYPPDNQGQYIMLGQSHYFVLGDNRSVSEDSRCYGPLKRQAIVGLISH